MAAVFHGAVTGDVLGGRYVLGEMLGRGGTAEVHRARDTVLNRDVAVKVFRHTDLSASDARRAGEVELLAGLSHPGLVTVFDAGRGEDSPDDPFAYLVMELVDGSTLRRALGDGPMPAAAVATLGAQLADALAYVHSRAIVHRDIKPANILLTSDGTAKLTDFGVARLVDSTRLTVEGTTLGTPAYLSPEQATGASLGAPSDIYSLGLVLLECLTGAVAFPGSGIEAAVARLHRDPVVPDSVGSAWADLLARMTARDPAARPSAEAVATSLRGLGSDVGATQVIAATTAPLPVAESPRRRRGAFWPIAGAAAAVIAAAVVATLLGASDGSDTPGTPTSPAISRTSAVAHPSSSSSVPATSSASSSSRATVVRSRSASVPVPPGRGKPSKPSKPSKPGKPKHGKPPKKP